jgi:hypothetical protein
MELNMKKKRWAAHAVSLVFISASLAVPAHAASIENTRRRQTRHE